MVDLQQLYEGKAKIIYHTEDPKILLAHFKDDATAFNALKRGTIVGKGEMNCRPQYGTISTSRSQRHSHPLD